MPYAYRNASGDIIGLSTVERPLAQAQAKNPNIVSVDPSPLQSEVDAYNDSLLFSKEQSIRIERVNARTVELIREGYWSAAYSKRFAIDDVAMVTYVNLWTTRTDPGASYPVLINAYDGRSVETLNNAAGVDQFYKDVSLGRRLVVDSGTPIIQQIAAATTPAQLAAIEDNR